MSRIYKIRPKKTSKKEKRKVRTFKDNCIEVQGSKKEVGTGQRTTRVTSVKSKVNVTKTRDRKKFKKES